MGGRLVGRALVLKMKDHDYTNIETAESSEISPRTVINICANYLRGGLESALNDDPRPGRPPKTDNGGARPQIVAIVCSDPPEGFDRWTLELLQNRVEQDLNFNVSDESIRLILHEHDLRPWRYKMWCVPKLDNEYIVRMNEILDLYSRPYNKKEPVVCVDEKPVILFGGRRKPIPFSPGRPNRRDYQYSRNGSVNVFCGVEPLTGRYFKEISQSF